MTCRTAACCVMTVLAIASPTAAPEPTLATVLERSAVYVTDFERRLSGIVAEEHYVQEVRNGSKRRGCPANATNTSMNCQGQLAQPIRTDLRSDLLLVRPAGASRWAELPMCSRPTASRSAIAGIG